MFELFKKKKSGARDESIVVIKKSDPAECGGTDATQDMKAPKEIKSEDMLLFDVTSSLAGGMAVHAPANKEQPLGFISAFAVSAEKGALLYLKKSAGFGRFAERSHEIALVSNDVFPALVRLVREYGLAKNNGFHSVTHGLPENFGGSVEILYSSGEKISFSNNQFPIISHETAREIVNVFTDAFGRDKLTFPSADRISEIRYSEKRKDGGFTEAVLTIAPDGSGINRRRTRFDEPRVYESEKTVDPETISAIRKTIEENAMLAWNGLPHDGFNKDDKSVTFVLDGKEEITVLCGRALPANVKDAFFDIELELTVKH